MKNILLFSLSILVVACSTKKESDHDQAPNESSITTPEEFNELSIFQIPSLWATQNNDTIAFKDLKGDVLAVVMIYTSCKAACPRLVADMRNIHNEVGETNGVKYVLVSIDPTIDTPERLKKFALENEMDSKEWLFLQGNEETVREFANILAVRYNEISPMDFSHSNIISVFDEEGVLQHQQEGLGVDYGETVTKIVELVKT
jgi:protein SCO1/2